MAASFTCHPDSSLLHHHNHHYYHHYHASLDQPALASALHPHIPPLDVTPRAISPCISEISDTKTFYSSFEVAEITVNECVSPPVSDEILNEPSTEMDAASLVTVKPPRASSASVASDGDGLRTPKRKRNASPSSPTSTSPRHLRSASRSTTGRSGPTSRRSSLHSHRRAATNTSLTPSISNRNAPEKKRETLLALHRESCRLFQDESIKSPSADVHSPSSITSAAMTSYFPPQADYRTASEVSSPPASPIRASISDQLDRDILEGSQSPTHPDLHAVDCAEDRSSKQASATIIDWTSPSTRRREYEKIDRASRGVRGFWRRVAPKWCRTGDKRTPFFEQGEDGKGNYEGSVRRFRMDLPDEMEKPSRRNTDIKGKLKATNTEAQEIQSSSRTGRRWPRLSRTDRSHTS